MTNGVLFWVFVVSNVAALVFSTVSYALRTISRVQLEEELVAVGRTGALERILETRFDLALTASVLRLVCNTVGILAVGAYFLEVYKDAPHPLKVFGWTVVVTAAIRSTGSSGSGRHTGRPRSGSRRGR